MKSALTLLAAALAAATAASAQSPVPLKEAKLNIEHNATDKDTGFQGAIDAEGWKELKIVGPEGVVLEIEAAGKLRTLGMTELFFESVEPANAQVPIDNVLSRLPEGQYTISGPLVGGGRVAGKALLTHDIPRGAKLLSPPDGGTVPLAGLEVSWAPVDKTLDGRPVKIIAYQLIVEKEIASHPHMIGKRGSLSMHLPPAVSRVTLPKEFLEPGTAYSWEVLAIEPSGNQTLSSAAFSTE